MQTAWEFIFHSQKFLDKDGYEIDRDDELDSKRFSDPEDPILKFIVYLYGLETFIGRDINREAIFDNGEEKNKLNFAREFVEKI